MEPFSLKRRVPPGGSRRWTTRAPARLFADPCLGISDLGMAVRRSLRARENYSRVGSQNGFSQASSWPAGPYLLTLNQQTHGCKRQQFTPSQITPDQSRGSRGPRDIPTAAGPFHVESGSSPIKNPGSQPPLGSAEEKCRTPVGVAHGDGGDDVVMTATVRMTSFSLSWSYWWEAVVTCSSL